MKAKARLHQIPSISQQISIGPDFCGPTPPPIPEFLNNSDDMYGILEDLNAMIIAEDMLYEAALYGNLAAVEELRLLSLRAVEVASQFSDSPKKQKIANGPLSARWK